jgi:hypothetical protein
MSDINGKLEGERFEYLIVKDNFHEYVIKREGSKQTFLLRAESREQVYGGILRDLYAPVYETTPGQMIEVSFGEPQSPYGGGFSPLQQAKIETTRLKAACRSFDVRSARR